MLHQSINGIPINITDAQKPKLPKIQTTNSNWFDCIAANPVTGRLEAAGALWNLSFDDERNPEAIAAAGGVEALGKQPRHVYCRLCDLKVSLAQSCPIGSRVLKENAAGALWGLAISEENSIAIGQCGGVAPLIALVHSAAQSVHETAAGALWNLAFNPGNALCIVEEGGVPALVHVCSCSPSKMARFMAALAMAYMFDGRMDEFVLIGTSSESTSRSSSIEMAKGKAMKSIKSFLRSFFDPQTFAAAAASASLAPLWQVAESSHIQEAGHLRCSSRHAPHHVALLWDAGAPRLLRVAAAAAAATAP
ncbi:hypothetical protein RHMOL_Rhmol07G0042100 [Rhododendron molle]|uniref:Uncharacterized protein n=1 Tax=Rhododendron molle TaxID=49168 RepID=A0ACC0MWV0_RHOML|nr:hypothetical protein RHMOL_Rhmol07G0042100 [Rhododendron molle]